MNNEGRVQVPRSELNPKFRKMHGEFVYKDIPWVSWTTLDRIKRIESKFCFYEDDVLIDSYPKSGTTLLQEMLWLLVNKGDVQTAKSTTLYARIPFIEENYKTIKIPGIVDDPMFPIDYLPTVPRPRLMKSHLPFRNLREKIDEVKFKIIIPLRDPKDVAVSDYNFYKGTEDYGPFGGDWNEFFEMWLSGWVAGGDWLVVIPEWFEARRSRQNILFVYYEEMVYEPMKSLQSVANFLNLEPSWRDYAETVIEETRFDVMRTNPMTNYEGVESFDNQFKFMRQGIAGDWKNWFSQSQLDRFNELYIPVLEKIGLERYIHRYKS